MKRLRNWLLETGWIAAFIAALFVSALIHGWNDPDGYDDDFYLGVG